MALLCMKLWKDDPENWNQCLFINSGGEKVLGTNRPLMCHLDMHLPLTDSCMEALTCILLSFFPLNKDFSCERLFRA